MWNSFDFTLTFFSFVVDGHLDSARHSLAGKENARWIVEQDAKLAQTHVDIKLTRFLLLYKE